MSNNHRIDTPGATGGAPQESPWTTVPRRRPIET